MPDISEIYSGGDYLKADDLQDRDTTVVIDRAEVVKLDDGQKICLRFRGKSKGLLLNKTNATNVAALYGHRTEGWIGKAITIGPSWVDYQGKSVKAIRVRPELPGAAWQAPPPPQQQPQPRQPAAQYPSGRFEDDLDDSVPF